MAMAALPAGLKADVGTTCDRCKIADWVAGSRPIPLAVLRNLVSAFKGSLHESDLRLCAFQDCRLCWEPVDKSSSGAG